MNTLQDSDGPSTDGAGAGVTSSSPGVGRGISKVGRAVARLRPARAAGLAGLAAAVVVGAAAERRLARIQAERAGDADRQAPPDRSQLPASSSTAGNDPETIAPVAGRPSTVIAADGVPLHVEVVGDPDAPLTIVFIHGFCVGLECWTFQRRDLAECGRLVFYDQRAHGRSGSADVGSCTIDQLGDDLYRVLTQVVPTGPVILVGHSMGGMTVLALACAHPELFGDRIIGVGLVSTSAGSLATVTFGLPAAATVALRAFLPGLAVGMRYAPTLLERGRRHGSDIAWAVTRRIGFGSTGVAPSVVAYLEKMVAATPLRVIAAFLPALIGHDKLAAAAALAGTPTLILAGDADVMMPLEHSRTLAEALPGADLVLIPGAGHAVVLESPDEVNAALRVLIDRATTAAGARAPGGGPAAGAPAVPLRREPGADDISTSTP